jgi:hypothetical protein
MDALVPQRTPPPTFKEIDHPRASAMRCSERARERSLLTKPGYEVSVITH